MAVVPPLHLLMSRRTRLAPMHHNAFRPHPPHNPHYTPLLPAGHSPMWTLRTYLSHPFCPATQSDLRTTNSGLGLTGPKTPEEVYGSITKPYDYTEGYHFLMKVLPFRYVSKGGL